MRITKVSGFVLVAALVAPVFAAPALGQSFLGEWTATAVTPVGDVSETLSVVKTDKGYAITAKLVEPPADGAPEAGPGTDIVLDGDKFSYKRSVTTPDGALVISYTGVVSGDTFTGTVDLGGFAQAPYKGVRIKRRSGGSLEERRLAVLFQLALGPPGAESAADGKRMIRAWTARFSSSSR
jgi:hypothetical protein